LCHVGRECCTGGIKKEMFILKIKATHITRLAAMAVLLWWWDFKTSTINL